MLLQITQCEGLFYRKEEKKYHFIFLISLQIVNNRFENHYFFSSENEKYISQTDMHKQKIGMDVTHQSY